MATRDLEALDVAYCLLIDGVGVAFFTSEDSAANASGFGDYTRHSGMELPSVSMELNLRTGRISSSPTSFAIADYDGTVVSLLRSTTPDDAPFGFPGLGAGATPGASLYGKHVGVEAIGAAGERRRWSCVPGYDVGLSHPSAQQTYLSDEGEVPVSDEPFLFAGRRCALYRLIRQPGGSWSTLSTMERVWWGTLKDAGVVQGRVWKVEADGPESWLRKRLGLRSSVTADKRLRLQAEIDLNPSQAQIWAVMELRSIDGTVGGKTHRVTQAIAGNTLGDIETAMDALVDDVSENTSGVSLDYSTYGEAEYVAASGQFRVKVVTGDPLKRGLLFVLADRKVWEAMGYVPTREVAPGVQQADSAQSELDRSDEHFVEFIPYFGPVTSPIDPWAEHAEWARGLFIEENNAANVPTFTHPVEPWIGVFSTSARDVPLANESYKDPRSWHNNGNWRVWQPYYSSGSSVISPAEMPVEVFSETFDTVTMQGQLDAPPLDDDAGGAYEIEGTSPVSATRLALLVGPRRVSGSSNEVDEYYQVARVSWTGGSNEDVGLDSNNRPRLVLHGLREGWRFHVQWPDLTGTWAWAPSSQDAEPVTLVPLNAWQVSSDKQWCDAFEVARMVLHSTGTSRGWFTSPAYTTAAYEGAGTAYLEPGDNDPGDDVEEFRPVDVEVAELGLGIPSSMIAERSAWRTVADAVPSGVRRAKVVSVDPVDAEEMLMSLLAPAGACISLRGGQYGVLVPWLESGIPTDIDATIDEDAYLASDDWPDQDVRPFAPIDRVQYKLDRDPWTGEYSIEREFASKDRGARYRSGGVLHEIDAPFHGRNAETFLAQYWRRGLDWWARRHFAVRGLQLRRQIGQDLWPGSRVKLTDPRLVAPSGTYGVTAALALVTAVRRDLARDITEVDLLVYEKPATGFKWLAGDVRVVAYDSDGHVLHCLTDWRSLGFGHNDLAFLARPDWTSSSTGTPKVRIYQGHRRDPAAWDTLTATVSSVDLDAGTITLSGAPSGGTWLRDAIHVLVLDDYTAQDVGGWVREAFAWVANKAGEVDGSTANASKWTED